MDASRDVMLKVTMGDRSAAAMFSWYLDDTPLAKVRILAASQKQKCLPTLTDQTCVTLPGLSWGWVSPLSPWSRSQGRGRWPAETQGSKTSNKHRRVLWVREVCRMTHNPHPRPTDPAWPITISSATIEAKMTSVLA